MPDTDAIPRASDDARRSADYSRAIVETMDEALAVVDAEYRAIAVNRSFCRLFQVSAEEVRDQSRFNWAALWCDAPGLRERLDEVISNNVAVSEFELDRQFPVIGRRCMLLNARRIDDSPAMLIALRDITEWTRARESELSLLRTFVERAPMGLAMFDRNMRTVQASGQWLDDVGLARERALGKIHYELFPDLPASWKEAHRRGLAGESLSGHEEKYLRPDGAEHWVNWRITPWGDAGETTGGILIASDDITERIRADARRRESDQTLRALLDSAAQAIVVVNPAGHIIDVNRMVSEMFGYTEEELCGQSLEVLIPEEHRGRHVGHHQGYFANMQRRPMGVGLVLEGLRRDGTRFACEIALNGIESAAGKRAVAFVTDVTQRRLLERKAESHAKQVEALAASLLTAQEDERRRVSRELHDQICQQLASLAMEVGAFAETSPPPPDERRARLKAIQTRVVKVSEETRHLAYELHPSLLDDLGLAASLRNLCRETADEANLAVEFSGTSASRPLPREVASCLYRVAQESLRNAVKHARARRVSVTLAFRQGAVTLNVRDDGQGFEVGAARSLGGLGLVGMEERARLVNGRLIIASRPGRGTRIALRVALNNR